MAQDPSRVTAEHALLAGDPAGAAELYRQRIAAAPAELDARYGLASALGAGGDGVGAGLALEEARTLHGLLVAGAAGADLARLQSDGDYAAEAGALLYAGHYVATASVVLGRAVAAGHRRATGLITYGLALQHQGRAEEAITVFRAASELYPDARVHQYLLMPHFMVENGTARYAAEAREWAARWTPPADRAVFEGRPLNGRRLKVGYVAPAFGALQVRQFITPVLEAHDAEAIEVFLYPATADEEGGWPAHIAVRPIGHLSDAEAAALIRADGVDVLIDCWGHSVGSRLGVFACRAAPVQVAWINFIQTTGLASMDYVLHADSMAAPGVDELFTEAVWAIGPIMNLFRPLADRPPPTPPPALRRGQVTLGSFNHPAKLSDATVAGWSRILKSCPGARLVLKYRYFVDPVLQSVTRARFLSEGVAPARIEFRGQSDGAGYLAAFGEIDLALDPWPCPGGTTTLDALSLGVPVLTLNDGDFYARIGAQALWAADLPNLVADSWDDYVATAVSLVGDLDRLAALRARVRPGFEAGPYRDEAGFTRRLEAAFRAMVERRQAVPVRGVAA